MGTALDNTSLMQHAYKVGIADSRQAMSYDQRGTILHQPLQRLLHKHFTLAVESRCSFVENQYRRIFQYRAGYRQTLSLPSRQ